MGRYNKRNLFNQTLTKIANQTVQFVKLQNCCYLATQGCYTGHWTRQTIESALGIFDSQKLLGCP